MPAAPFFVYVIVVLLTGQPDSVSVSNAGFDTKELCEAAIPGLVARGNAELLGKATLEYPTCMTKEAANELLNPEGSEKVD